MLKLDKQCGAFIQRLLFNFKTVFRSNNFGYSVMKDRLFLCPTAVRYLLHKIQRLHYDAK